MHHRCQPRAPQAAPPCTTGCNPVRLRLHPRAVSRCVGLGMLTLIMSSSDESTRMLCSRPLAASFAAAVVVASYGAGLGPVVALLPAELLPAAHRASGASVAWSLMWLAQCLCAAVHLELLERLGPRVFVPNMLVLVLGFGFALAVMPETRGKSLEKIAQEMSATD